MIRFKPEVRIIYFNDRLVSILLFCSVWSLISQIDVEINSIDDSKHGQSTLHGYSLAVDIDTVGDNSSDLSALHIYLKRNLSDRDYDVILESDHIHVEFDPK